MQRLTVVVLIALAALAPARAAADCSPSIGQYASLANFTILAELLDATGLYNALNNTPITVFAPTDDAFVNALTLLDVPAEALVAPNVIDALTGILSFHVSLDPYSFEYVSNRTTTTIETAAGPSVTAVFNEDGKPSPLYIEAGDTTGNVDVDNVISLYDCNVYVYPVDSVLLPEGGLAALTALLGAGAPAPAPSKAAAISG